MLRSLMAAAGLSATFIVSACASPPLFDKPGLTQAEFNKDKYECERETRQSGYFGGGYIGRSNMQDFFQSCMIARGYSVHKK